MAENTFWGQLDADRSEHSNVFSQAAADAWDWVKEHKGVTTIAAVGVAAGALYLSRGRLASLADDLGLSFGKLGAGASDLGRFDRAFAGMDMAQPVGSTLRNAVSSGRYVFEEVGGMPVLRPGTVQDVLAASVRNNGYRFDPVLKAFVAPGA